MAKEAIAAENVAMGHQRRFCPLLGMSGVPPTATNTRTSFDVCEVPITTEWRLYAPQHSLFDDLIGAGEQHGRDCEAVSFGRGEVDDQIKFSGLLHRQIGRLRSA